MRKVLITDECLEFINEQDERVIEKFYYLIEVISEIKVVNSNFVKKIIDSDYYELRIKAGNEYRVLTLTLDSDSFIESEEIICLNGFVKKSKKDYKKAITQADTILLQFQDNNDEEVE